MKTHTKAKILEKVLEIWDDARFYDEDTKKSLRVNQPEFKVEILKNCVEIEVSNMYESPSLSFDKLSQLSEFFGTRNISDSKFSNSGCETCDYGSSYGFTLYVRNDK